MSIHGFITPRTVSQAVVIPPLLFVLLENFRSAEVNRDDYCGSPLGEVAYVQSFLRPFAHIIRSAIPSTVCGPDDMPFGRIAELEKYVVAYLERGRPPLCDIVRGVSSHGAAIMFDYFLGKPTYGYVPDARESFLSRISLAANLANKARGPSSALDVQLTPDFASLPQVPSWSRSRISTLESLQLINNWVCENALLEDGIEQNTEFRAGRWRNLRRMRTWDAGGAPSCCRYPGLRVKGQPSDSVVPNIVVLWIHRARHLAQDLHHTTRIAVEEETPEETVGLIRDAVSMLLKNMVALGKASLKYGSFGDANTAGYFVPPEGTTLFGMAERFVDLYGYHRDTSPFDRALMFDNLKHPVLHDGFGRGIPPADLERYGIYEFIKPRQIARLSSEDPGTVVHQFGDRLLRYNPKLGDEARYQFPDPSREYAATRPNTLVLSPVAEVADEMMEEEEDSDKENESWAAFLEFRLRPMVYFVHAAVTHDFTLIGAKGVYSLVELDHIKYWVGRVLLHCVGDFVLVAVQDSIKAQNWLHSQLCCRNVTASHAVTVVTFQQKETFYKITPTQVTQVGPSRLATDLKVARSRQVTRLDSVQVGGPKSTWRPQVASRGNTTAEITALVPLRCTFGVHGRRLHPLSTRCRSAGGGDSHVRDNAQSLLLGQLPVQPGIVDSQPRPPDSSGRKCSRDAGTPPNRVDYPAFNEHGQLLIPDFYSVEARPQDVSPERNIRGHPVSTR
ncbi:hypothetical protein B0H14DRAFT_2657471 [Mycena olivaceomarginata]|nr:hypothetical protein B0H14DRAFT_2657471 [Mycena olivaceomarginata]